MSIVPFVCGGGTIVRIPAISVNVPELPFDENEKIEGYPFLPFMSVDIVFTS
jgi:hypothetical protein